jgi:hypothetical protein
VPVPTDREPLAQPCLEGERWDTEGPTLSEILAVTDETAKRLRERRLAGRC